MDEGAEREVRELRLRLYRPDPPRHAVEDYLSAAERSGVPAPVGSAPTADPPTRRRVPVRIVIGVVVSAVAVPALLLAARLPSAPTRDAAASPTAPVPAPLQATGLPGPGIPDVPEAAGYLIGTATSAGPRTVGFDAEGLRVLVTVACLGSGTTSVRIDRDPPLLLACDDGSPSQGIVAGQRDLRRFHVSATTTGRARWSLAVGAVDVDDAAPLTTTRAPSPRPSATR